MRGRVLKSTGSWYKVEGEDSQRYNCRIRGKIKLRNAKTTNPVAVGDWVQFEKVGDEEGIISDIEERTNYIIRKSVHKTGHGHILASNIDQLMLMVTLRKPKTSLGFIDRMLINAESFRIPAILVFNKVDLLRDNEVGYVHELSELYSGLGYHCYEISAKHRTGLEPVENALLKKVTLIAGHSGVGKSTYVNTLNPEVAQQIKTISGFSQKGKHTTTFAEMFQLAPKTYLIDSPGIKELGIIDMEDWEISHYFPEMRQHLGACKFSNCLHVHEPDCAVLAALQNGTISESRYLSYLSILEDYDNRR